MENTEELIKNTDIQKIAEDGAKIYKEIKSQYKSEKDGKFLAIDIDTKETFLADTSSEAVEAARKAHPNKVFYVVKIGSAAADILARLERNL